VITERPLEVGQLRERLAGFIAKAGGQLDLDQQGCGTAELTSNKGRKWSVSVTRGFGSATLHLIPGDIRGDIFFCCHTNGALNSELNKWTSTLALIITLVKDEDEVVRTGNPDKYGFTKDVKNERLFADYVWTDADKRMGPGDPGYCCQKCSDFFAHLADVIIERQNAVSS
jgi:hypothetical protein